MNKILVVEDDESIRELLVEVLRSNGYGVRTAANGWDALYCIQAYPKPRIVLLDLRMPVMNGEEFIAATRKLDSCKVPILVVTAEPSECARALKDERIVGVLEKPFTIEQLMKKLSEVTAPDVHAT